MSNCNDSNATHHTGCACWEAKRDARIDQLEKRQVEASNLQAELDRCKEENERLRQRLGLEEKFWTVTVEE